MVPHRLAVKSSSRYGQLDVPSIPLSQFCSYLRDPHDPLPPPPVTLPYYSQNTSSFDGGAAEIITTFVTTRTLTTAFTQAALKILRISALPQRCFSSSQSYAINMTAPMFSVSARPDGRSSLT